MKKKISWTKYSDKKMENLFLKKIGSVAPVNKYFWSKLGFVNRT